MSEFVLDNSAADSASSFQVVDLGSLEAIERMDDLRGLAASIREHHEGTECLKVKAGDLARRAMNEALLCGMALRRARGFFKPRAGWLRWLNGNCPELSHDTARNYMAIASYYERVRDISEFRSLVQLYLFLGLLSARGEGKRGRATFVLSAGWLVGWASRIAQAVPDPGMVIGWSEEEKMSTRAALEPAVRIYEALKT
jgi:hypothetical protein